jgi:hypothetical protein
MIVFPETGMSLLSHRNTSVACLSGASDQGCGAHLKMPFRRSNALTTGKENKISCSGKENKEKAIIHTRAFVPKAK